MHVLPAWDDEEEPPVVGEKGQHPPLRRDRVDDDVDPLGEDVSVHRRRRRAR